MPDYEFQCRGGHVTVRRFEMGAAPKRVRCEECGRHAERQISLPMLHFHGMGFMTGQTRAERGMHGKGSALLRTGKYHDMKPSFVEGGDE